MDFLRKDEEYNDYEELPTAEELVETDDKTFAERYKNPAKSYKIELEPSYVDFEEPSSSSDDSSEVDEEEEEEPTEDNSTENNNSYQKPIMTEFLGGVNQPENPFFTANRMFTEGGGLTLQAPQQKKEEEDEGIFNLLFI